MIFLYVHVYIYIYIYIHVTCGYLHMLFTYTWHFRAPGLHKKCPSSKVKELQAPRWTLLCSTMSGALASLIPFTYMAMAQNYGTKDPQISDHGHSRKTIQLLGVDNFEP